MATFPKISIFDTQDQLARGGAELFVDLIASSFVAKEHCLVALAGGSTPQKMYNLLANEPYLSKINWQKIHFFISDERFVPLNNDLNNFGLAKRLLLNKIPVPPSNIHPIETENITPEESAVKYLKELERVSKEPIPKIDIIFLGVGADGHTASLFPVQYKPKINEPLILITKDAAKPPPIRITFSMRLINHARHVVVMASGKDKAETFRKIFKKEKSSKEMPAAMIQPSEQLYWLLDKEAGSALNQINS